jgi:hypothetical protein
MFLWKKNIIELILLVSIEEVFNLWFQFRNFLIYSVKYTLPGTYRNYLSGYPLRDSGDKGGDRTLKYKNEHVFILVYEPFRY